MKVNLVKTTGEVFRTFQSREEFRCFLKTLLRPLKVVAKIKGAKELDVFIA